jgi:hypothetical protein
MSPQTFLNIPAELRDQVYSYLTPITLLHQGLRGVHPLLQTNVQQIRSRVQPPLELPAIKAKA